MKEDINTMAMMNIIIDDIDGREKAVSNKKANVHSDLDIHADMNAIKHQDDGADVVIVEASMDIVADSRGKGASGCGEVNSKIQSMKYDMLDKNKNRSHGNRGGAKDDYSGFKNRLAWARLSVFLKVMGDAIALPILPFYFTEDLGGEAQDLGYSISLFAGAQMFSAVFLGWLSDFLMKNEFRREHNEERDYNDNGRRIPRVRRTDYTQQTQHHRAAITVADELWAPKATPLKEDTWWRKWWHQRNVKHKKQNSECNHQTESSILMNVDYGNYIWKKGEKNNGVGEKGKGNCYFDFCNSRCSGRPYYYCELLLAGALSMSAAGYALMARSNSIHRAYVGRTLSGLAGGAVTVVETMVSRLPSAESRAHSYGHLGAVLASGIVVGPPIASCLLRWPLLLNRRPCFLCCSICHLIAAAVPLLFFIATLPWMEIRRSLVYHLYSYDCSNHHNVLGNNGIDKISCSHNTNLVSRCFHCENVDRKSRGCVATNCPLSHCRNNNDDKEAIICSQEQYSSLPECEETLHLHASPQQKQSQQQLQYPPSLNRTFHLPPGDLEEKEEKYKMMERQSPCQTQQMVLREPHVLPHSSLLSKVTRSTFSSPRARRPDFINRQFFILSEDKNYHKENEYKIFHQQRFSSSSYFFISYSGLFLVCLIRFCSSLAATCMGGLYFLLLKDAYCFNNPDSNVCMILTLSGICMVIYQGYCFKKIFRALGYYGVMYTGAGLQALGIFMSYYSTRHTLSFHTLIFCLIYTFAYSIIEPSIPTLAFLYGNKYSQGFIHGSVCSCRYVATIVGPLIYGQLYTADCSLPFLMASIISVLSLVFVFILQNFVDVIQENC